MRVTSSCREPIEFLLADANGSRAVSSRSYVFIGGEDWHERLMTYRWCEGDTYSADASDPNLDDKVEALLKIGKPVGTMPRYVTF